MCGDLNWNIFHRSSVLCVEKIKPPSNISYTSRTTVEEDIIDWETRRKEADVNPVW